MDEVFLSPQWPLTCEDFRTRWTAMSDEHRFQLCCLLIDTSQAARSVLGEYTNKDGSYSGINNSPWVGVHQKWLHLGILLRELFGDDWRSSFQAPRIYLSLQAVMSRCSIPRDTGGGGPVRVGYSDGDRVFYTDPDANEIDGDFSGTGVVVSALPDGRYSLKMDTGRLLEAGLTDLLPAK